MRMQVILDSVFARPGSAPIGGGKKGEFRDWTNESQKQNAVHFFFGEGRGGGGDVVLSSGSGHTLPCNSPALFSLPPPSAQPAFDMT